MLAAKERILLGILALGLAVATTAPAAASIPPARLLDVAPEEVLLAAADPEATPAAAKASSETRFRLLKEPTSDRFRLSLEARPDVRFHLLPPEKPRVWAIDLPEPLHIEVELPPTLSSFKLYEHPRPEIPSEGTFITPDPLGYLDAPNLYQAFGNNPANYSDPMGLYLCSGTTTECMNFEKERQAILTNSKLSALHPQANAYGDPQINNGVEVSFGQTSGYGVTTAAAVYDSSTQMLGPEIKVEFDPSLTALEWGLVIVHEGQHIMDAMDFISTFKKCPPNTCTQSGDYWWDDSLNITNYETERRAYLVSHEYLKAMGQTFGFGPSKTRIGKGVAKNAVDKNVEKIIKEVDALTPQDVTTQVNWLPLPPNTPKPP
jgi:hypothetical protein